mmetsp:Transcript_45963/g.78189  ORF Transcript_45963/g.78189 Transcript_45963/m.78189 type:complete len:214 (+) Transcript_45963:133-774(+)
MSTHMFLHHFCLLAYRRQTREPCLGTSGAAASQTRTPSPGPLRCAVKSHPAHYFWRGLEPCRRTTRLLQLLLLLLLLRLLLRLLDVSARQRCPPIRAAFGGPSSPRREAQDKTTTTTTTLPLLLGWLWATGERRGERSGAAGAGSWPEQSEGTSAALGAPTRRAVDEEDRVAGEGWTPPLLLLLLQSRRLRLQRGQQQPLPAWHGLGCPPKLF